MKYAIAFLMVLNIGLLSAEQIRVDVEHMNIDSSIKAMKQQQAEFDSSQNAYYARQESIAFQQSLKTMNNNMDAFMAEQRERERAQTRSLWIRGAFLAVAVVLLIVNAVRNRSKKSS